MPVTPKQSTLALLSLFSRIAAISVAFVGSAVLIGWLFGSTYLKSVVPGLATMKVNTAVCLVAAGRGVWALRKPAPSRRERLTGQLLASFIAATGALTLVEYVWGIDFGIDQSFLRDPDTTLHPGRMAPSTALSLALAGLALWILEVNVRVTQWLAVAILLVSTLAIVGYAFGVRSLYQISVYVSMAIHTAVSLALLAMGILATRPTHGFMAIANSDSMGGIVARRLLPLMPMVLFCLGLLPLAGEVYGLYDGRFGMALMVTLSMIVATVLVAHTAPILYKLDLERRLAEDEVRALNEGLERRVAERTQELEQSLAQIKELRGLLPICAWCKKIRDGKDYWHTVEAYISAHTDARFTHGICPECFGKATQDLKQRVEQRLG